MWGRKDLCGLFLVHDLRKICQGSSKGRTVFLLSRVYLSVLKRSCGVTAATPASSQRVLFVRIRRRRYTLSCVGAGCEDSHNLGLFHTQLIEPRLYLLILSFFDMLDQVYKIIRARLLFLGTAFVCGSPLQLNKNFKNLASTMDMKEHQCLLLQNPADAAAPDTAHPWLKTQSRL